MKEIVIPQKSSAFYKILISLTIPSIFLGYIIYRYFIGVSKLNIYFIFFCAISFMICLLMIINTLIKIANKKPAMIINQRGMIDNVSMANAGFIDWKEITGCFIAKMSGVDQLFISVKDHTSILSKQNPIKKGLLSVPISDHGTPIAIDLKLLNYSPQKLQKIILSKKKGKK